MSDSTEGRITVNAHTTPFLPYDLEGPVQPELSWLPISYEPETQQGSYLMRMEPGAVTIAHDHPGMEEFLVLEVTSSIRTARSSAPATSSATRPARTTTRGRRRAARSLSSSGERLTATRTGSRYDSRRESGGL